MELLDIYDDKGNKTGRTIIRGDKTAILNEGEHIALSIIFIQNKKGEFLIQKTSKQKGGLYSSTGGHVSSGYTPLETIIKEVKEELGINIDPNKLEEYGYLSYDMPLRYLYYIKDNIDIKDITVQKEEVDHVEYMTTSKINNLIDSNQMLESHGIMFNTLLEKLNK
ncbi:MAG: NUDIX domain-containing protein [Bacilli bacterium]|nr:NUDIX domain-containing protein [Bacilli bacterium]